MPKRNDLHVISGGKSEDGKTSGEARHADSIDSLVERARHYRQLLSDHPDSEMLSLVNDMADAIEALGRLDQSTARDAPRAAEYRRLTAELENEIITALKKR